MLKRVLISVFSKHKTGKYNLSTSALEKTFNSRPSTNLNLITKEVGLFNVPQLTSLDGFHIITEQCIRRSDDLIAEAINLNGRKRSRKMVEIFDELSDSLCQAADLAEFVRFAHPSPDYSKAAEGTSLAVSELVEKLNTNVQLYEALKRAVNIEDKNINNEVDNLVGKLFLFDFEQSGIDLNDRKREKAVILNNLILFLGQKFVNGVAEPKLVDKKRLPDSLKEVFASDGDDRVIISGLFADSPNYSVREMAYKFYLSPDQQQEEILVELLNARNELANICGFSTYSERALGGSILDAPSDVMELLNKLRDDIADKAQMDFIQMTKMKQIDLGGGSLAKLGVWDVPYYSRKAKSDLFNVNAQECSPYLSLGACMEGLNIIFQSLYGISLINAEINPGEVWSKDVYKLAVIHEIEGLLGYIYCDFYERHYKPNQDCHFTIRGGKVLDNDGTYQLPIVVLMLSLPLPRWSSPTLLTPTMLDNLFHEMGHAMHSMLARTKYQHISGTRCSTDLAEVPSILMEYFASDPRVIKLFAKHFQTNEPMPNEMLHKLCASKRLFSASDTQLQIFYAALDQIFHGKHPLPGTTTDILASTQSHYYGLPYVENTTWHLRFSHLVGYGAKYYSYLVSRALAHLIWNKYFVNEPLSRSQGEKYRKECLSFGGGKNPQRLISDYLQLKPTGHVLAKSLVDEIDDNQKKLNELLCR